MEVNERRGARQRKRRGREKWIRDEWEERRGKRRAVGEKGEEKSGKIEGGRV